MRTGPELSDNLPTLNYDGRNFRIVSYETENCNGIHVVEELNGEIVNDTTYEINRNIESRFNIVLKEQLDGMLCLVNICNTILAGDDICDVNLPNDLSTFPFVQNNLAVNFRDLTYIDLDRPYWDASLNARISINNQFYYALARLIFPTSISRMWSYSPSSLSKTSDWMIHMMSWKAAAGLLTPCGQP